MRAYQGQDQLDPPGDVQHVIRKAQEQHEADGGQGRIVVDQPGVDAAGRGLPLGQPLSWQRHLNSVWLRLAGWFVYCLLSFLSRAEAGLMHVAIDQPGVHAGGCRLPLGQRLPCKQVWEDIQCRH